MGGLEVGGEWDKKNTPSSILLKATDTSPFQLKSMRSLSPSPKKNVSKNVACLKTALAAETLNSMYLKKYVYQEFDQTLTQTQRLHEAEKYF